MSGPRVFVTTDIGGDDKDDDQTMVHLLLHADQLRIEGLASSPPGPGRAADIQQVIDAYQKDYPNLASHAPGYPAPADLRALVCQGAVDLAPATGVAQPTDASRALIAAARAGSAADPLYVLAWGSIADVAQALHDASDIADKIRILSIGRQDANADRYMLEIWKNKVWWIDDQTSFRGVYAPATGDNTPIAGWPDQFATGHGALGAYLAAHGTDLYGALDGDRSTDGLKMGDAPSTLYLLDAAPDDDPTAASWGGRFVQAGVTYWTDDPDPALAFGNWRGARTVAEHRADILADFAARLDRAAAPAAASVPAPAPALGRILVGVTEAETLKLAGFVIETHGKPSGGQWIKTAGAGTASGTFAGPAGTYAVAVTYMDENDGISPISIAVNGRTVQSWAASANDDQLHTRVVQTVLNPGDAIAVTGTANVGEYARIDRITVEPVAPTSTAQPGAGGPDTLAVTLSEDAYQGHARFVASLDGADLGPEQEVTALHGRGLSQTFSFQGTFGPGPHTVGIRFVEDAWGGTAATDRNLYVDGLAVNGTPVPGGSAALYRAGTATFTVGAPAPVPAPAPAPAKVNKVDLFAFAGQSNAAGHFYQRAGDASGGPLGKSVFEADLSAAAGHPVIAVNVAVSGSGSNQFADPNLYWWDIAHDQPSAILRDAVATIAAAEAGGRELDGLVWAQGEDDARLAYGTDKQAVLDRLAQSTQKIFAYIRQELGDPHLPIFLQELGSFPGDVPADRYDAARAAQSRVVALDPDAYLGATTTDLSHHNADRVHYSNAEYGTIAHRLADSVAHVLDISA